MGAGLPKAAPMPGGLPKAAPMPAMGAGGAGGPGGPAKPSGRWVWVPHGGKAPKNDDGEKKDAEEKTSDDSEEMADLMAQIPAKTHASDDPLEGSKKGSEVASDQEVGAKEASKKDSEV